MAEYLIQTFLGGKGFQAIDLLEGIIPDECEYILSGGSSLENPRALLLTRIPPLIKLINNDPGAREEAKKALLKVNEGLDKGKPIALVKSPLRADSLPFIMKIRPELTFEGSDLTIGTENGMSYDELEALISLAEILDGTHTVKWNGKTIIAELGSDK